jgi:hypothetical protein
MLSRYMVMVRPFRSGALRFVLHYGTQNAQNTRISQKTARPFSVRCTSGRSEGDCLDNEGVALQLFRFQKARRAPRPGRQCSANSARSARSAFRSTDLSSGFPGLGGRRRHRVDVYPVLRTAKWQIDSRPSARNDKAARNDNLVGGSAQTTAKLRELPEPEHRAGNSDAEQPVARAETDRAKRLLERRHIEHHELQPDREPESRP